MRYLKKTKRHVYWKLTNLLYQKGKTTYEFSFGFLQVTPENIQIQILPDGRLTGDALISFMTRSEAERAIATRGKQTMGQCLIELFLAWYLVKYAMQTFTTVKGEKSISTQCVQMFQGQNRSVLFKQFYNIYYKYKIWEKDQVIFKVDIYYFWDLVFLFEIKDLVLSWQNEATFVISSQILACLISLISDFIAMKV